MADNKDFTHASGGSLTKIGDGSKRKARRVAPSFEIVSVQFLSFNFPDGPCGQRRHFL
jgi:hypothetical protein